MASLQPDKTGPSQLASTTSLNAQPLHRRVRRTFHGVPLVLINCRDMDDVKEAFLIAQGKMTEVVAVVT